MFLIAGSAYAVAKMVIPKSVEIYFAGIAGCTIDEEAWAASDPQFDSIKWWERVLTHVYRIEQNLFEPDFLISDWVNPNISALHILIVASDETAGQCDHEIIEMMKLYIEQGAPIDYLDTSGLTPLQTSVLFGNYQIAELLFFAGADADIPNQRTDSSLSGMSAREIASLFALKNPTDDVQTSISGLLNDEM